MAFSKAFLLASAPNNDVKINLKIKTEFFINSITFTVVTLPSMCISFNRVTKFLCHPVMIETKFNITVKFGT